MIKRLSPEIKGRLLIFAAMKADLKLLEHLESFLTPQRKTRFERVIGQRTNHFTVVTEDVYQLHNTSAVVRSCDVFGIQNLHVVEEVNLKRIDREIAMGAQKWVDVNRYTSIHDCMGSLRKKDYRIVATSPHEGVPLQEFDITRPAALFFGTEKNGLSEEVLKEADEFINIPMFGFTESLNISVSAAIILQELTARLRKCSISWRLSEEEQLQKRIDWAKKNIKNGDEIIEDFYSC